MGKQNIKVKSDINITEKIAMINMILDSYFTDGNYTPYFNERARINAIAIYMLDGIEYDENISIYDTVVSDPDIYSLVMDCMKSDAYQFVSKYVDDMLEVKKKQYTNNYEALSKLISLVDVLTNALENFANLNIHKMSKEDWNTTLEFMKNMSGSEFTEQNMANVLKKVMKAHRMPNTKIYKEQQQRIANLNKIIAQKDQELKEQKRIK